MITPDRSAPFTPEEVALLIDRAGRAPSIHNSQPWRFAARGDIVEVHADPTRALPVADPYGRERLISCGAALFNLRLTMGHLGFEPLVRLLPHGPQGQWLASIARGNRRPASAGDEHLYAAICHRRTQRRPFDGRQVSASDRLRLRGSVMEEGAWVAFLDEEPTRRREVARLMAAAAAADAADPAYRAELNRWIRGHRPAVDGIPLRSLGTASYPVDGLPREGAAVDPSPETVEQDLARSTTLVVGSMRDAPRDWLAVGQGLQRMLLAATTSGLACAFANQLTELPALREELGAVLGTPGHPQLLLRVGHPLVGVPQTPRRDAGQLFHEADSTAFGWATPGR